MTYFPLYPYHSDPLRILGRRAQSSPLGEPPLAAPEPPPLQSKAEEDNPPRSSVGEAADAPAVDGGVDSGPAAFELSAAPEDPSTPAPVAPRSPSPSEPGEDQEAETLRQMRAWLDEHWDTVEAMACAGEAPRRPPPPPEPCRGTEGPAEPPERPHVARGDRWTKWKMAEFLRQLAATHSVTAAAKAVGMSRVSAYKLRSRLKGQPFDVAWEAAFRHGFDDLAHAALELALEGEEVPHYHQGELVATHRKRNPQLMIQLLKMRNSVGVPMLGRYGAAAEFWSERWEKMTHRVQTGSVTWDDERKALGPDELEQLTGPDEERELELIIKRNLPDEPKGPFGRKV